MEICASMERGGQQPFFALIVAGGNGTRLGGDIPKQYQDISGIPLLRRTISAFLKMPGLLGLMVVRSPDHQELYARATHGLQLLPPADSGHDRMQSVKNGLIALQSHANVDDIVLIHDAARPFISSQDIANVAGKAAQMGAATLAARLADTIIQDDGHYADREKLHAILTPQAFRFGVILDAHNKAAGKTFTDDSAVMRAAGHECALVEGSRTNFKITTEADMHMANLLTQNEMETRTGSGFDVHAFDTQSTGPLRLCGIDIAHPFGLLGHSDADVGLHTITDALFGAVAGGDIGSHFPPSDPQWKGKDSAFFLAYAVDYVRARGGRIINIDLTIICEAPKVGPHREAMQNRIAEICNLSRERISVKATTTEKLGFTGRGEGIAAQAVCTVAMPAIMD